MNRRENGGKREWSAGALLAMPLLVALLVGWAVVAGWFEAESPVTPKTSVGAAVPAFSLPPLEAMEAGLADGDLRGAVSIVNFWASWCAPCREEMPFLFELAQAPGAAIYGVNSRDRMEAARRFLSEAGDPYRRIGVDADGSLSAAWGIYGLPATFVVDAGGRIAHARIGPLDRRAIDEDILPLLDRLRTTP